MTWAKVATCLILIAMVAGFVSTQPPGKDKEKAAKGKNAKGNETPANTLKVEKKPFKIALTVKGILSADETAEISYRPHPLIPPPPNQGPVTIRQIVEHGTQVKQGDLLVAFDTTKIDEVIADLEREMKSLDMGIKLAELEQPFVEKSVPLEVAAAETAKKRADEDLKYFLDVNRAHLQKEAEWLVKHAKFSKEYAEEELQQLEKMYKANDLTESTEKMVLRRQQNQVEYAIFSYQTALLEREYILKFSLPNREKTLKENQQKQELLLAKAQSTLGPAAVQKQVALAKMRFDVEKNAARLEALRKDRAGLTINAPSAGIVYYGKFHKGQWTGGSENKLVVGGNVSPDEVFMTVVKAKPAVVYLTIEEKDAYLVKPGLEGKVKVPFQPDRKLNARVAKLVPVPASPGKFEAQVTLDLGDGDAGLVPGMACSVQFIPYAKQDALAIPTKAVHEDNDRYFVDVVGKKGQAEKREVKVGRTDGEHTEILEGLRQGDDIFLDRPSPKAAQEKQVSEPKGDNP
jgi:hypothetical protein